MRPDEIRDRFGSDRCASENVVAEGAVVPTHAGRWPGEIDTIFHVEGTGGGVGPSGRVVEDGDG